MPPISITPRTDNASAPDLLIFSTTKFMLNCVMATFWTFLGMPPQKFPRFQYLSAFFWMLDESLNAADSNFVGSPQAPSMAAAARTTLAENIRVESGIPLLLE